MINSGSILGILLVIVGIITLSTVNNHSDLQDILLSVLNAKIIILLVSLTFIALGIGITVRIIRVRM